MSETPRQPVVVVGAGPAGMAAAACAAENGARVLLVDDNPGVGGQIWRGADSNPATSEAQTWRDRVRKSGAEILCGGRVFDAPEPGTLLAETWDGLRALHYSSLILATGARERFLPFPGWTLPNVMGAGGLQAMVKSGMPIEGKRVVVAGTGPLLLAVAAYLATHGAKVLAIAEQAPLSRLVAFSTRLLTMPAKLSQAFSLNRNLRGVPIYPNCWPVAAPGTGQLESVTLLRNGKTMELACDYLACGFHLIPNVELPVLLGCKLDGDYVAVDDCQATSVANVYCAGEPTGIGGVELSIIEGEIAGLAAAGRKDKARQLLGDRAKYRGFARAMDRTFALRPELRSVADDVLVCRCEDVAIGRVRDKRSWREAKLHTRIGMGPCQGRVCGGAASFLFGWRTESIRPPVFPARVDHLAPATEGRHSGIEEFV